MEIIYKLKKLIIMIKRFIKFLKKISETRERVYKIQEALGRIESRQIAEYESKDFLKSQFRVFSQWGEDGLLQYLVSNVKFCNNKFIEFGVEDYYESNTRFLLSNNNWSGLIIDGDSENINKIKKDTIYWASNLIAINQFITKDNINEIIKSNGFSGNIGILSIDIDGNDFWIFKAIDVVKPDLIIIEYNSIFGCDFPLSVPYDKNFVRTKKHYSNIYYGSSIRALNDLAVQKGYSLIASNDAGNNLFFLRKEILGDIKPLSVEKAFKKSVFRESKNFDGQLSYLNYDERVKIISDLDLINTNTEEIVLLKDLKK